MKALILIGTILLPLTTYAVCDLAISPQDYEQVLESIEEDSSVSMSECRHKIDEHMADCKKNKLNCSLVQSPEESGTCNYVIDVTRTIPKTPVGEKLIKCDKLHSCLEDALYLDVNNIDDDEVKAIGRQQSEINCESYYNGPQVNSSSRNQSRESQSGSAAKSTSRPKTKSQ